MPPPPLRDPREDLLRGRRPYNVLPMCAILYKLQGGNFLAEVHLVQYGEVPQDRRQLLAKPLTLLGSKGQSREVGESLDLPKLH